jgi:hypothetical protein
VADGSIRNLVPQTVLRDIKEHVIETARSGESGWRAAPGSEDVLTGHLFSAMQIKWSPERIVDEHAWRWRIDYRKFRSGNQNSSEEKPTGADGIVQVEVKRFDIAVSQSGPTFVHTENVDLESFFKMGILFQSKRVDSKEGAERLISQLKNMEQLTPQNAVYLEYGPHGYMATKAADVIEARGVIERLDKSKALPFGNLMSDEFLECKIGLEDFFYDFDKETLNFPNLSEAISRLGAIDHGLRIRVNGYTMVPFNQNA